MSTTATSSHRDYRQVMACRYCGGDFYASESGSRRLCAACNLLYKWCPYCKQVRARDEFSKNRALRDGLAVHCTACRKVYSIASAIFWGVPDGSDAEPVAACEPGDGAGAAAAAACAAARAAARRAALWRASRSAARWARNRVAISEATSPRATPASRIPRSEWRTVAGLALGCGPAIASRDAESPADAPEVVIPATTAAGTATATPAIATVILESFLLCVNRLRFFGVAQALITFGRAHCALGSHPGALPADDTTPGRGRGAQM